jgi:soluble lytic murein transglycosylase-like protein
MRPAFLALACALSACAPQQTNIRQASYQRPEQPFQPPAGRYYPPPGPPEDPWGPYIRAAAARYGVSEVWVRAVMQRESGGRLVRDGILTTSPVGAMGLMQVMPDTYAILRDRYGLRDDPYEPHDNIFAGTAYIREMYDLYGYPAFLAAYNAGPNQLDACLSAGAPLPQETVDYLSAIAPQLRATAAPTGKLAAYADLGLETPADDLNRRMLTGQALPVAVVREPPVLPCAPPASDHMADDLNRGALAAAGS